MASKFKRVFRKLAVWKKKKLAAKPLPEYNIKLVNANMGLWKSELSEKIVPKKSVPDPEKVIRENIKTELTEIKKIKDQEKSLTWKEIIKQRKDFLEGLLKDRKKRDAYKTKHFKTLPLRLMAKYDTRNITYRKHYEHKKEEIVTKPKFVHWMKKGVFKKLRVLRAERSLIEAINMLIGLKRNTRTVVKTSEDYCWLLAEEEFLKNIIRSPNLFMSFATEWQKFRKQSK